MNTNIDLAKMTDLELKNLNDNICLEIKFRAAAKAREIRQTLKIGDVVRFNGKRRGWQTIRIESFKGSSCIGGGWRVDLSMVEKVEENAKVA